MGCTVCMQVPHLSLRTCTFDHSFAGDLVQLQGLTLCLSQCVKAPTHLLEDWLCFKSIRSNRANMHFLTGATSTSTPCT